MHSSSVDRKTFLTAVRDELMELTTERADAELCGLIDGARIAHVGSAVRVRTSRLPMIRRMHKLLKDLNDSEFNARIYQAEGSSPTRDVEVQPFVVNRSGLVISSVVFDALCETARGLRDDDLWIWLRGIWEIAGSVNIPQSGYYMSFRLPDRDDVVGRLRAALALADISPASRRTGGTIEFTLRRQEHIVTCLSSMGAVKSALALEETSIVRSLKSRANQLVNCDSSNIRKTVSAARTQMALVETIERHALWDRLPPLMVEIARLRESNPSLSLRELGQLMDKPVSKSTVEYRWRRLESFVDGMIK